MNIRALQLANRGPSNWTRGDRPKVADIDKDSWWFSQDPEWKGFFHDKLDRLVSGKWSVWSEEQSLMACISLGQRFADFTAEAEDWLKASWVDPIDFYRIRSAEEIVGTLAMKYAASVPGCLDGICFDAHGGHKDSRFDSPVMYGAFNKPGEAAILLRQSLKSSNSLIFFTGCNVALREPAEVQKVATVVGCPVIAATEWMTDSLDFRMGCRGVWIRFDP